MNFEPSHATTIMIRRLTDKTKLLTAHLRDQVIPEGFSSCREKFSFLVIKQKSNKEHLTLQLTNGSQALRTGSATGELVQHAVIFNAAANAHKTEII